MDAPRIQDTAEMDRKTIVGIGEVAERLTRRVDTIIDPEVRDRYEDAIAALVFVCKDTR